MKKMLLLAGVASLFAINQAAAQETVTVVDIVEDAVATDLQVPCGTRYFSTKSQNWFIEASAGIDVPFVDKVEGHDGKQITANYALGFGKWFSPYVAWRAEANYGARHWNWTGTEMGKFKALNVNLDIMWDMFNSLGGVNTKRVFSIVPFIGAGLSNSWDYNEAGNYHMDQVSPSISAGLQLRFRLSRYVNFFMQGRAAFFGDHYNNYATHCQVDADINATAGFTFKIGGDSFNSFNPCDYTDYIANLNDQVNALRGDLITTAAALAAAQAQLPCPEVTERIVTVETAPAALLSTVRFNIDSSTIKPMEKVNVYNMAKWLKDNDANVVITGYADRDTGTASYNMALSERRAKAVYNMLVNEYGINADRLSIKAEGSSAQPYDVNNWNRIVTFTVAE